MKKKPAYENINMLRHYEKAWNSFKFALTSLETSAVEDRILPYLETLNQTVNNLNASLIPDSKLSMVELINDAHVFLNDICNLQPSLCRKVDLCHMYLNSVETAGLFVLNQVKNNG